MIKTVRFKNGIINAEHISAVLWEDDVLKIYLQGNAVHQLCIPITEDKARKILEKLNHWLTEPFDLAAHSPRTFVLP